MAIYQNFLTNFHSIITASILYALSFCRKAFFSYSSSLNPVVARHFHILVPLLVNPFVVFLVVLILPLYFPPPLLFVAILISLHLFYLYPNSLLDNQQNQLAS